MQTEISYYLRIAIDINKKIGGKRGYCMYSCLFRGWGKWEGQVLNSEGQYHQRYTLSEGKTQREGTKNWGRSSRTQYGDQIENDGNS